jgi:hypothetical protein
MTDSVARMIGSSVDYGKIKRDAWRKGGILVVDVDGVDGLTWPDRELLREVGDRLYGQREAVA